MYVTAIRGKQGLAAQESAKHRQHSFQNRKTKRDHRNSHRNQGRSLLRTCQRKRAQHEPYEQTAAVAEKNSRGVEVEAKETKNRTCQSKCERRDQEITADQRNDEHRKGRKQGRSRGEPVHAIEQIESVCDPQYPQYCQRQREPRRCVRPEQKRQLKDSEAAEKQQRCGQRLHGKLDMSL